MSCDGRRRLVSCPPRTSRNEIRASPVLHALHLRLQVELSRYERRPDTETSPREVAMFRSADLPMPRHDVIGIDDLKSRVRTSPAALHDFEIHAPIAQNHRCRGARAIEHLTQVHCRNQERVVSHEAHLRKALEQSEEKPELFTISFYAYIRTMLMKQGPSVCALGGTPDHSLIPYLCRDAPNSYAQPVFRSQICHSSPNSSMHIVCHMQ